MSALPYWCLEVLRENGVKIERHGRASRGRPSNADRRWVFCGWYWYQEKRKGFVNEGPYGPYPCPSAAITDALRFFGFENADKAGSNITDIRRYLRKVKARTA